VRLLNEEFKRQEWPGGRYSKFMRYGAVEQLKAARQPAADEPKIATPRWALERAAEIGAETAENISALGVRVIGDISTLGSLSSGLPEMTADSRPAEPLIPAGAAAQAVIGAFLAGGAGGQTAEAATCEVTASHLAAEIVRRGGRRALRRLRLSPDGDRAQPSPAGPRSLLDREADRPATQPPSPVESAQVPSPRLVPDEDHGGLGQVTTSRSGAV
jgi:hypothetical protein